MICVRCGVVRRKLQLRIEGGSGGGAFLQPSSAVPPQVAVVHPLPYPAQFRSSCTSALDSPPRGGRTVTGMTHTTPELTEISAHAVVAVDGDGAPEGAAFEAAVGTLL